MSRSTGALTRQERERQDERYREGHRYDYLVIGTGMAALTASALLARDGARVCLLEAHDVPGGYVHTFRMGDYRFCAQIHYIWGCAPGEAVDRFLGRVGLRDEVEFVRLDPEGYDHAILPDGKRVTIPCGFDRLAANVEAAYPGQGAAVREFCRLLENLDREISRLPEPLRWWHYLTHLPASLTLLGNYRRTLQEVFDRIGVGREAQAVLAANTGDFMCPPRDLSILAYNGLFSGYNRGAYYPKKHFRHFIDRIVASIADRPGCHVYYETRVTGIGSRGDRVTHVTTADGKRFEAPVVLCNADPPTMARLIGLEKFPATYQRSLTYDYSLSAVTVYLGVEGLDLREHGFGSHNTWQLLQWDVNAIWDDAMRQDWSAPWVFMATPTLHTPEPGTAPGGGQILELATGASYDTFKRLRDHDRNRYELMKRRVRDRLIEIVESCHVPGLRDHIKLHVTGSPTTNEDFCLAPRGHAYGQHLTPANMGPGRLTWRTPFRNFHWCSAASGYPGVSGTVGTGMRLYTALTGEIV